MGRRRTRHFDLPLRMQRKGTSYYYVCNALPRRWIPLGSDLAKAKRKWAELDAGAPPSPEALANFRRDFSMRKS